MSNAWKVHKFGGSSVADAACMQRVAAILEADPAPSLAVVLSAARGVTDALLNLITAAERQEDVEHGLEAVRNRHVDITTELCDPHAASEFIHELDADCRDIASILHGLRARAAHERAPDSPISANLGTLIPRRAVRPP